jgi:hypothetical protein
MVTVCWLLGSVVGIHLARQTRLSLNSLILVAIAAYFACVLLLAAAPFNTRLWPVYAFLVMLTGLYPGMFFARMSAAYPARALFFHENNGFIVGLVLGSLLFTLLGRSVLWVAPIITAVVVYALREPQPELQALSEIS